MVEELRRYSDKRSALLKKLIHCIHCEYSFEIFCFRLSRILLLFVDICFLAAANDVACRLISGFERSCGISLKQHAIIFIATMSEELVTV